MKIIIEYKIPVGFWKFVGDAIMVALKVYGEVSLASKDEQVLYNL